MSGQGRFETDNGHGSVVAALRRMADTSAVPDMSAIEQRLLREFAWHHQSSSAASVPRATWRQWVAAAAIVLVVAGLANIVGRFGSQPLSPPAEGTEALAAYLSEFVVLPGVAALPPFESGRIVRIEVPVASLPAYGVAITADARGYSIEADVLVGQDGLARAIRLDSSNLNP